MWALGLQALVYVSTAFSNCDRQVVIRELVYPTEVSWRDMIDMVENVDENVMEILSQK
jgi:hypothetical protein